MPAYSGKAQPFLDAIASGFFAESEVRNWVLEGTSAFVEYKNADCLDDEQKAVRWINRRTKQPFWANYWCGKDSACTCRPPGSKGLESDAIFFLRNGKSRTLAVHVEFKHPGEQFGFGQPEAYPMRAECFSKTHATRKTVNAHQDWTTVLFCGDESLNDQRLVHFERVITHAEARKKLKTWPKIM